MTRKVKKAAATTWMTVRTCAAAVSFLLRPERAREPGRGRSRCVASWLRPFRLFKVGSRGESSPVVAMDYLQRPSSTRWERAQQDNKTSERPTSSILNPSAGKLDRGAAVGECRMPRVDARLRGSTPFPCLRAADPGIWKSGVNRCLPDSAAVDRARLAAFAQGTTTDDGRLRLLRFFWYEERNPFP